jgi:glucose-6-phosphate 1-dehydrogenase
MAKPTASFTWQLPPTLFPAIIDNLDASGQLHENGAWRRVVLEKPFGTDLARRVTLNKQVHKALNENQIYRIDHYLGKETVQNILFTRFANTIFEPIWNRTYIDHVQITVAEKVGLEHRAGFYDGVGVLRDMFQNHLLQLLTLVAMEPPASFSASHLRNEKVKVLSAVQPMTPEQVRRIRCAVNTKAIARKTKSTQIPLRPPMQRSNSTSTTGAGRACRSICARAKTSPKNNRRSSSSSKSRRTCHVPHADHEAEHARAVFAAR